MIIRYLLIPQLLSKQFKEQIRFPTSANTGDDLDQTIVALRNKLVQVDISTNFHFIALSFYDPKMRNPHFCPFEL